jgi:Inhibitor of growth proteins N-terminal histone-binding
MGLNGIEWNWMSTHRILSLHTTSDLFDEMVLLQQQYVQRVEETIERLEVVENGTKVRIQGNGKHRPAIIPTTEELIAYVTEPESLRTIEAIQVDTLQRAEEKVAIAEQTLGLIDNVCKRLDADLEEMKKLLQHSGEFQKPGMPKPNDLAAIQVTPGASEWILAKVIAFEPATGMYRLSDEDVESNKGECVFFHFFYAGWWLIYAESILVC